MKTLLLTVLACASAIATAQSTAPQLSKTEALAKVESAQGDIASLNASAREVSKQIGVLALSGKVTEDPAAMEEMKRLVAALDEINARLESLESSIADLKAWAAGKDVADAAVTKAVGDIDKIKFSNYFQFQFRDTDQAGKEQHSFEMRRFRLGMTMQINDEASMKASFDVAAGTNRSGAELKDAMMMFRPKGTEGLLFTAGQFALPLGYETEMSNSVLEFPERVAYNKTLFNDERLRGVMASQKMEGGFSVYGGIVNSLTTKDAEQSAIAPGPGGRLAGFGGVKYANGDLVAGLGYFAGKRPEYTSGGTSPEVDRHFLYADLQLLNIMNSGLYLRAEGMAGSDRVPSSTGNPANVATDMTGYHTTLGYKVGAADELFTRYSLFDPDTDTDGDAINEFGLGWRHWLGTGANVTLAWENIRDLSVANSPYSIVTCRLQFKF